MPESKPIVLVIDDNPQNLKLSRFLLEAAAFHVVTAPDAEQALVIIEETIPALILVDVQLPGMDGLALTRRFRQIESLKSIGIVALTAYAMKGDEEKAFEAGCNGYITKPIDTRTFASTVRDYLKQSKISEKVDEGGIDLSDEFALIRDLFFDQSRRSVAELIADPQWVENPKSRTYLHQIAGAGGNFGAVEASSLASEAEKRLRNSASKDTEDLSGLLIRLRDALNAADQPSPSKVSASLRYEKKD